MPAGQSHTTWFLEMIKTLRAAWDDKMSISEQFDLVKKLNEQRTAIRLKYNVQPSMIWCSNFKKSHPGNLTGVTITAMYYFLKRFNIFTDNVFKRLMKDGKFILGNTELPLMETRPMENAQRHNIGYVTMAGFEPF